MITETKSIAEIRLLKHNVINLSNNPLIHI